MSVAVRQYSFRPSVFFLWDMDEGRVRTIPLLNDIPVPISVDDAEAKKRERLLFHIQSGDYFGMLATALGFVEEALHPSARVTEGKGITPSEEALLVQDLRNDLRYLHNNYDICPKKKGVRQTSST